MEFGASGAGSFAKTEQHNDLDMSALQGRLSETRLSEASLFDETFFDAVMRESLDAGAVGRDRESFDGSIKLEGMGTRTSVDGNYGRGSLDCGYRGSLDMRGSLDIRADTRGSIDQGYMGSGFDSVAMRDFGQFEEPVTNIIGDHSIMPPVSVPYMTQYSCSQNPIMPPPKMNKDGTTSQLNMLHQQQQPHPNFLGGVYSQSQFMLAPSANVPMPQQQPIQHYVPIPQTFPQTMKNLIGGILKKPSPKPETQVKRTVKKKNPDTKSSKNSSSSASSRSSHDSNGGNPVSTNKTSSYRGVSKASTNSWGAKFSGKRIKSTCKSEQEAAEVYDDFLRKHRPDLFVKLANFCPQCGADRVRGPQCICFNDINPMC